MTGSALSKYLSLKAREPNKIHFVDVGDFVYLYGDDAVNGAKILGKSLMEKDLPGGGVISYVAIPADQLDVSIAAIVRNGYQAEVVNAAFAKRIGLAGKGAH